MSDSGLIEILLVDDQAGERELLTHALGAHGMARATRMEEGVEGALSYLREAAARLPQPVLPKLILLDLKLKNGTGLECLRAVRATPHLAYLPVVVLTTSDDPRDVRACYAAGANGYAIKPDTLAGLTRLIGDICDYWLGWNHTPASEPSLRPVPATGPGPE
jgi:CheY-like chemotaxis protein